MPSQLGENIALCWLASGFPTFAIATLAAIDEVEWVGNATFNRTLLSAAYFGCHVWPNDQASISRVQKELNFISHHDIEDALRQRGGRTIPYLVLSACLQATIFSGNYTNAPRLLEQVRDSFDPVVQGMINDIVNFSNL